MYRLLLALLLLSLEMFAQTRALRFKAVWDGNAVVEHAVVLVDGNKIVEIRKDNGKFPKGAEVVDLRRYSAIPGMIDVHTHITYYWDRAAGTNPRRQARKHPAVTTVLTEANARKTLESGVTTIRDLNAGAGNDYALRDLIAMGKLHGPRIVAAGQGIGARPNVTLGIEGMKKAVEERLAAGSDVIKLFASTGGFEDVTGRQTLTFDEMKAAVDATHAAGKRIAIHTYGPDGFRDAVKAGPDSIEHGADVDDATLRDMAAKKIWFVPTIDHNRYYVDAKDEFQFAPGSDVNLRDYIARNLDTARRAHLVGVKFAMGDAVYTMFGQNTRELEWLVKAGLTNEEALRAATVNGAELLGMSDKIGKLAPGYFADIVAIDGEPWKDVNRAINGVRWVMKDGKVEVEKR